MRRDLVITRVKNTLKDYKTDESKSKYYKELKISYDEFTEMGGHDRKVDKLYLKHMNDLCDYLEEKRNYRTSFAITFIMIIFTAFCAIYASFGLSNINHNVKPRIMTKKPDIELNVLYKDTQNLMLQTLPEGKTYESLNYALVNVSPKGDEGNVEYNIYIIPTKYNKTTTKLEDYYFNVDGTTVNLSQDDMMGDRIKIYTGKMNSNDISTHKIRMWVSESGFLNSDTFTFKIYVDGYLL